MLQIPTIEDIFQEYFKIAMTPARIIEFGTMTGRFTNIIYDLRKEIDNHFDMITIDSRRDIKQEYLPENMIFCQMDIFSNIETIAGLIKPKTLILCDNGNKIKEVRSFGPQLRSDCVIMAHDYFYDREKFESQETWPVCEITWADISDLGLKPYYQHIMDEGFWLSLTNIK